MNKQLTTKQEIFLDNLIDCEGDAKKAAELAGYAPNSHFQVVKSLKTEILDRTESILAQSAPKAALKITDIMNSTQPIPQAKIRMQEAQMEAELRWMEENPGKVPPSWGIQGGQPLFATQYESKFNPGIPMHEAKTPQPINLGAGEEQKKADGPPDKRFKKNKE